MPLPTKTPSQPSCIMSAASAGVAMPPAAKLTTGSLFNAAVSASREYGAWMSLARTLSSVGDMVEAAWISRWTVRWCRTASITSPVPASPLVRIIAAPSLILRSASPRLRQPQTKGVSKSCFSTWWAWSAGVRTSDSSM